jgi:hypothetical protein
MAGRILRTLRCLGCRSCISLYSSSVRYSRGLLDFTLLEVVHIHMDAVCVKVSFKLMCCGGNSTFSELACGHHRGRCS